MDYEYEVATFLQNSDMLLQNPENIEPSDLAAYFVNHTYLGVHDHITSLV